MTQHPTRHRAPVDGGQLSCVLGAWLVVREGDIAEVLESLFAARYGFDDATRDELALAIDEHSKMMGFVRPLFVLEVSQPG